MFTASFFGSHNMLGLGKFTNLHRRVVVKLIVFKRTCYYLNSILCWRPGLHRVDKAEDGQSNS